MWVHCVFHVCEAPSSGVCMLMRVCVCVCELLVEMVPECEVSIARMLTAYP